MTSRYPVLCRACQRFNPATGTCAAFPEGIPESIVAFGGDHRTSVPGDQGIVFLQAPGEDAKLAFNNWFETEMGSPKIELR